ncbi:diphthine synthase [Caldisphaera lagunensis DSM 15908]|uniref:Diphthine synthase n=1 Tax=Caldisphaera lagunensis (strain DSM 15908 / JCM 11604 / ANMR 0165 / IC-154) TaxID=1056495 RepID=L0AAI5_CALLD|nr:diphthine synthase [Caldisphaera lagunensis]AFZ70928.1 diphthine synthase [Caldisphaera lagunensis DSM 15908]
MPLYLIGLNHEYITKKALEYIKSSDLIIIDSYTMPNSDKIVSDVLNIAKEKKVIIANRRMLEDESSDVLNIAKEKKVGIIIPGDPLIATTHASIVIDAKIKNIDVEIINGISGICMTKSLSGLQYYKYGKTLTIPGPWRNVKAYSLLFNLYANLCIKAHTLLLFDIDDNKKTLDASIGIKTILELNNELKLYSYLEKLLGILIHAGDKNMFIGNSLRNLLDDANIEEPYSLVIPSNLHSEEEKYLKYVLGIKSEALENHKKYIKEDFCKYMQYLSNYI